MRRHHIGLAILVVFILSACTASESQIATAIAKTELALPSDTPAPTLTFTPTSTFTLTPSPTSAETLTPTSTITPTVELLGYTLYHDNSTSDYGSFKVMWDIIITSEEITKPLLENLMNNLFEEAYQLLPGKNDDRNQLIFIYIYASKEHADSGMGQWIGMVSKYADSSKPSLMFDELQINALSETPEITLGLSELERKEIWNKIIHAEDRAFAEAEKVYPDTEPYEDYSDLAMELIDKYMAELAWETGLSLEELDEIGLEGMVKNWPFPTRMNW